MKTELNKYRRFISVLFIYLLFAYHLNISFSQIQNFTLTVINSPFELHSPQLFLGFFAVNAFASLISPDHHYDVRKRGSELNAAKSIETQDEVSARTSAARSCKFFTRGKKVLKRKLSPHQYPVQVM